MIQRHLVELTFDTSAVEVHSIGGHLLLSATDTDRLLPTLSPFSISARDYAKVNFNAINRITILKKDLLHLLFLGADLPRAVALFRELMALWITYLGK